MTRTLPAVLAAGLLLPAAAQAQVQLSGDPKIAFIYTSPANDGGWSESFDRSRPAVEAATGVASVYVENVPEEKTQVRQAVDLYAGRGYNIIVGTSFGFGDALLEAAEAYPDVAFLNAAGITEAPNLESFYVRTYQGWYLAGIVAGAMTESDKLGMVVGFPIPLVNWDVNAFARGARAYNPDAEVLVSYVNTWFDPVKERQAAEAQLEQGVDVIATTMASPAVLVAAEEQGRYAMGYQNDMSAAAPNGHLLSVVFAWEKHLIPTVERIAAGTWTSSGNAFLGIDTGIIALAAVSDKVPAEVMARVEEARQAIAAGTMTPFDGPVRDQAGEVVVEEGRSITDDELWDMNYLVEGVVGSLPAQ